MMNRCAKCESPAFIDLDRELGFPQIFGSLQFANNNLEAGCSHSCVRALRIPFQVYEKMV